MGSTAGHNHGGTHGTTLNASTIAAGTLVHERGGLEADVSAGDGFVEVKGGSTSVKKSNLTATAAPTVNEDSGDGYAVGSIWIDVSGDKSYILVDATGGAAVWIEMGGGGGGAIGAFYDSFYPHINVPPSGTADTFGSYVELVADVGTTKHLYYVLIVAVGSTGGDTFELEIATGAASSEVTIARVESWHRRQTSSGFQDFSVLPIGIDLANNVRLSGRTKRDTTGANDHFTILLVGPQ
jgi:hypothetical protein